ncbi:MAG: hypothetical protein WCP09_03210 [Candidatus Taylorbacteria bacterium]
MLKNNPMIIRYGAGALVVIVVLGLYIIFSKSDRGESSGLQSNNVAENSVSDAAKITKGINDAYVIDSNAVVVMTDNLFLGPMTSKPIFVGQKMSDTAARRLEALRSEITYVLRSWKDLTASINTDLEAIRQSEAKAKEYADAVRAYLSELQAVVNKLTPGNSGLDKVDIDNYKAEVAKSVEEADRVLDLLDIVGGSNGSNVSGGVPAPDQSSSGQAQVAPPPSGVVPPPSGVEMPKLPVYDPQTYGTEYQAPPAPQILDTSGTPYLIEGSNQY